MTRITQMGVTVAVPVEYVDGKSRTELAEMIKDLADQALPGLRRFVGDIAPQGPMAVNLAGPVDDPLQGLIYGLTVAAPFDADALPADCDAYLAYGRPDIQTVQYDQGPLQRPEAGA